jgi:hypothetical protein
MWRAILSASFPQRLGASARRAATLFNGRAQHVLSEAENVHTPFSRACTHHTTHSTRRSVRAFRRLLPVRPLFPLSHMLVPQGGTISMPFMSCATSPGRSARIGLALQRWRVRFEYLWLKNRQAASPRGMQCTIIDRHTSQRFFAFDTQSIALPEFAMCFQC